MKSTYTISTSGDRTIVIPFECIGLNSIPISNINYKEIFGNNMIYSDINNIIKIIKYNRLPIENDKYKNNTNRDILLIDYWRDKISQRLKKSPSIILVDKNYQPK